MKDSPAKLYLGHVVEFQVSLFQYGTDPGQEGAGETTVTDSE